MSNIVSTSVWYQHPSLTRAHSTVSICVLADCEIFAGLSSDQDVLLTHGDSIEELAECCQAVAHSGGLIAAIEHKTLKIYGLQFHPEVDLTNTLALPTFLRIDSIHASSRLTRV